MILPNKIMNMMVKSFTVVLAGMLIGFLSTNQAFAETSGDYEYTVSGGKITITRYIGAGGDVEIPSEILGNPVTGIGDYAFYECISLTSVTIPSSVTSIGCGAFECCISLASVTIPEGVTSIGGGAFSLCRGLTSVTIPDSVTSIGERGAFAGCTSLTSVIIGNSVTRIGIARLIFASLASVTIGNGVTIENNAFLCAPA